MNVITVRVLRWCMEILNIPGLNPGAATKRKLTIRTDEGTAEGTELIYGMHGE